MSKRKRLFLLSIALILIIGVCGCMNMDDYIVFENEEKVVLTERQKKILQEKGLPLEYSQLTSRQKMTIVDIEEMLQSVEAKYAIPFSYVNYSAEKQLESGVLTAISSESNSSRDMFTVERDSEGNFVDTYMCVAIRDQYEKRIASLVSKYYDMNAYREFATVLETAVTNVEFTDDVSLDKIVADNWLFLNENDIASDDFKKSAESIIGDMKHEGCKGSLYIVLVHQDCFALINGENYTNYLARKYVIARNYVDLSE